MFGDRVRKFRIEKGLSQEALADRLHVVRQTVSKWEKGFSVPDADLLQRLADIFDVPLEDLLGATETETTDLDLISKKLSSISERILSGEDTVFVKVQLDRKQTAPSRKCQFQI